MNYQKKKKKFRSIIHAKILSASFFSAMFFSQENSNFTGQQWKGEGNTNSLLLPARSGKHQNISPEITTEHFSTRNLYES